MIRAKTEELKHIPWFAKAGAACSIVPISRFVGPNIFALKGGGYAVHMKTQSVQHAVHEFTMKLGEMIEAYAAKNLFPLNATVEIRITGLDGPHNVAAANSEPPTISALSKDDGNEQNGWDMLPRHSFSEPGAQAVSTRLRNPSLRTESLGRKVGYPSSCITSGLPVIQEQLSVWRANRRSHLPSRLSLIILRSWENGDESWIHVHRGQRPFEKDRLGPEETLHGENMAKPIPVAIVAAFLWIAMLIGLAVGVALCSPGPSSTECGCITDQLTPHFKRLGKHQESGFSYSD